MTSGIKSSFCASAMEIQPASQLTDITTMSSSVKIARPPSTQIASDRRRSTRAPHIAEAWVVSPTATRDDERMEVQSLNLSRHGVMFELHAPLAKHSFYLFEVGVGEQRMRSEIRIISCAKNQAGAYEVGAEFC
jgi:hypothetical protein